MKKPEYKSYRDTLRIACLLVLVCICGYYAPEFPFPGPVPCKQLEGQKGYCSTFASCLPDESSPTGWSWHPEKPCDQNFFWNPDFRFDHGGDGSCDTWEHLSPATQKTYRIDAACPTPLGNAWEEDPECDNMFYYSRDELSSDNKHKRSRCPDGSFWNQSMLKCGTKCKNWPKCKIC